MKPGRKGVQVSLSPIIILIIKYKAKETFRFFPASPLPCARLLVAIVCPSQLIWFPRCAEILFHIAHNSRILLYSCSLLYTPLFFAHNSRILCSQLEENSGDPLTMTAEEGSWFGEINLQVLNKDRFLVSMKTKQGRQTVFQVETNFNCWTNWFVCSFAWLLIPLFSPASIFVVGCLTGSLVGGYQCDILGRR